MTNVPVLDRPSSTCLVSRTGSGVVRREREVAKPAARKQSSSEDKIIMADPQPTEAQFLFGCLAWLYGQFPNSTCNLFLFFFPPKNDCNG